MINKKTDRQAMIGYALTGTLLLFLFLLSIILRDDNRDFLLKEGCVVESASAFCYFLCVAFIAYKRKIADLKHFFLLFIFFMLRELDCDRRFTTMSIFKSRFFTSPKVPLIEKVIGTMVILLLIYLSVSIVYRHAKDFLIGLKKRSAVSFGALLTFTFLVVSKSLDGLARNLKWFGIAVSQRISLHTGAVEEILELGIPIVILITLNAHFKDIEA